MYYALLFRYFRKAVSILEMTMFPKLYVLLHNIPYISRVNVNIHVGSELSHTHNLCYLNSYSLERFWLYLIIFALIWLLLLCCIGMYYVPMFNI